MHGLTNLSLTAGPETGITYDYIDPRTSTVPPLGGFYSRPQDQVASMVALFILVGVSVAGGIEAAVGAMADAHLART
jgi:hypothetical protein